MTRWSSHSEATLQAAFADVDWDMFRASSSDVSEFWVDRTIRDAVNHRTAAYNAGILSGNMSEYKASCYALRRAVRAAKRWYRERI